MASIFDDYDPNESISESVTEDKSSGRNKKRLSLTPAEVTKGKRRLSEMVESAFKALEEAVKNADYAVATKAAQIILDRAGFGPRSSVDLTTTAVDLSNLTREELAERALLVAQTLKNQVSGSTVKPTTIN